MDEVNEIAILLKQVVEKLDSLMAPKEEGPMTISVAEAAKELGISVPKAYQVVHRKDFPSFEIDRRVRVIKADLPEWMRKQAEAKQ